MKVLYLIDTLEMGGAEKSLLEILSHFRRVQPVMCHIYPGHTLKSAYQQARVPVISLDLPGKYSFRAAICQVKMVAQQEQVDLIHTTLFRANFVGRMAGRGLKIPVIGSFVSEPYASIRWQSLAALRQLKLRSVQLLDSLSARWTCHFTANSETVKAANARVLDIPLEKISVIYRGRDPGPFLEVSPPALTSLRAGLKLEAKNPVVLNVARLLDTKGQADLVRAMPLILQKFPQVKLLIAGEGNYRPQLETLTHQLGLGDRVCLLGQRDDIPTLLHLADLFVFPSYYEGYPGALVEAMLAAKPIVASDIPVHHEAIHSGETGLLVPLKCPEVLAQSVIWMLQHPAKARQMGQQGQEVALERFQIKRIAAQHEELYETVLRQWNRRG